MITTILNFYSPRISVNYYLRAYFFNCIVQRIIELGSIIKFLSVNIKICFDRRFFITINVGTQ